MRRPSLSLSLSLSLGRLQTSYLVNWKRAFWTEPSRNFRVSSRHDFAHALSVFQTYVYVTLPCRRRAMSCRPSSWLLDHVRWYAALAVVDADRRRAALLEDVEAFVASERELDRDRAAGIRVLTVGRLSTGCLNPPKA